MDFCDQFEKLKCYNNKIIEDSTSNLRDLQYTSFS